MTLKGLAANYFCDKFYRHSYMDLYDSMLSGIHVDRLLEIGIGYEDLMKPFVPKYVHGASLKMWSEYWPFAKIYACDIRQDTLVNEGNIYSWVADQSSVMDLLDVIDHIGVDNELDVIIDDGSHQYAHQLLTAHTLLPYLCEGGLYFIEDVWPDTGVKLAKEFDGDYYGFNKCPDDGIVVIRK